MKNQTPEEAWNGSRPSVVYFRVFGCVAHMHVPDVKRKNLDAKSLACVFLGVSEEYKAYRLYDPIARKIVVSRCDTPNPKGLFFFFFSTDNLQQAI